MRSNYAVGSGIKTDSTVPTRRPVAMKARTVMKALTVAPEVDNAQTLTRGRCAKYVDPMTELSDVEEDSVPL